MNSFVPTPISVADQDDIRADARMDMFFALRKAFNNRSDQCGIKAKDLSEILSKDKGYVSRVLNGSGGSVDFETLSVFLHALGYHLPLNPVAFEDLYAKRTNFDVRPNFGNNDFKKKSSLYDLRYYSNKPNASQNPSLQTKGPKIKEISTTKVF